MYRTAWYEYLKIGKQEMKVAPVEGRAHGNWGSLSSALGGDRVVTGEYLSGLDKTVEASVVNTRSESENVRARYEPIPQRSGS